MNVYYPVYLRDVMSNVIFCLNIAKEMYLT